MENVTAKELAKMLDGAEYGLDDCAKEIELAKENGLVIVYGASDDLMEFCGAIYDEADVYGGRTVRINKTGVVNQMAGECALCPFYREAMAKFRAIKAVWCPEGTDFTWIYETDIPHEVFRVLEDGEHYCLGIVFSIDDLGVIL